MPDPSLHGNNDACPACDLRRADLDLAPIDREPVPCNACGGTGWIPLSPAEITRRTAEHARQHHWPAFDARNRP